MADERSEQIVNVMKEERLFSPPPEFAAKARIGSTEEYERLYRRAADDLEGFWGEMAADLHCNLASATFSQGSFSELIETQARFGGNAQGAGIKRAQHFEHLSAMHDVGFIQQN